jgi:hypothetical protein
MELAGVLSSLGGKQKWSWRFATTDGLVADNFQFFARETRQ